MGSKWVSLSSTTVKALLPQVHGSKASLAYPCPGIKVRFVKIKIEG